MEDLTIYSPKAVQITLDGRDVQGLWEGDDAVTIERSNDRSTSIAGADGKHIVSVSADESVTVTLRLQHTSAAHAHLRRLEQSMTAIGGKVKFPLSIRDTRSNEGGSAAECVIMGTPSVNTGGENAGAREWRIMAARWEWNQLEFEE